MKIRIPIGIVALLVLAVWSSARADDRDALIKKGDAFDAQLETPQALAAYLAAEKLAPPNAELLRRIAKEYGDLMPDTTSVEEKRNLGEKALDYARQAVAADPRDAMAQLAAAVCYGRVAPLMDNKTKIAYARLVKVHADKSLAIDPNNDLTYNVLGAWNYAMACLNPVLRVIAGMMYGRLPDASYQEAANDYSKALKLNPNRLANHIGLGRAYAAMGYLEAAKVELERGLSMPDRDKDDPFEKEQGREALDKI